MNGLENIKETPITKPRILMIGSLPPPVHGSAMMTQYIKDSMAINDRFILDWINISTSRSMKEIGKNSPIKALRLLKSLFLTIRKLCTRRYKFCYIALTCHGSGFLKDAPFALLCKLFGYKLVIHQHNKGMSKDISKPLFRRLLKVVYKDVKVILLSKRLYPDISNIVSHDQIFVCSNGIPEVKTYSKLNKGVPQLLFFSNLIESKGVFTVLDACKILKDNDYTFRCSFIGSETPTISKQRLEKEINLRGLKGFVYYYGPIYNNGVNGEDKYKAIAACDIFVFPTLYPDECFPLVLLEAMQQGKPIVTSTEGAIPDIVTIKNGYSIPNITPKLLADHIALLLNNKDLQKNMGIQSKKQFESRFTLGHFEKKMIEIFDEFANYQNKNS